MWMCVRLNTRAATYPADYVIVTVPLGVLKRGRVAFTPALPSQITSAVAKLGCPPALCLPAPPDCVGASAVLPASQPSACWPGLPALSEGAGWQGNEGLNR